MQTVRPGQDFQWLIADIAVPVLLAEFTGRIRNKSGDVIHDLEPDHFQVEDAENGVFSVNPPKIEGGEAMTIEIYGQLPGTNSIIIYKGRYENE